MGVPLLHAAVATNSPDPPLRRGVPRFASGRSNPSPTTTETTTTPETRRAERLGRSIKGRGKPSSRQMTGDRPRGWDSGRFALLCFALRAVLVGTTRGALQFLRSLLASATTDQLRPAPPSYGNSSTTATRGNQPSDDVYSCHCRGCSGCCRRRIRWLLFIVCKGNRTGAESKFERTVPTTRDRPPMAHQLCVVRVDGSLVMIM
jgi:hypothetical protein